MWCVVVATDRHSVCYSLHSDVGHAAWHRTHRWSHQVQIEKCFVDSYQKSLRYWRWVAVLYTWYGINPRDVCWGESGRLADINPSDITHLGQNTPVSGKAGRNLQDITPCRIRTQCTMSFSVTGKGVLTGLPWIWISMDISMDISMCGVELSWVSRV